ncbi:hypothetical protein COT78_03810 [Candidatus Berkelbacteria bacterium CG10_big_fil_rev_8_21_14_0_10_43_13]|uniref:Uncharacterized protein n=1 Tax=Candidatus Berkelbacteria bacterium CG10_big_fil_rev_8_21_14_0_10_43_13 TaxID=1974514 RepID=A0A2H0W5P9_9BACT|nr:MAG: hypothetical protein COT78_03810 [Candidatus Berkelbacteria bacterium CG10_big_fil_rev_8_21_14_0_10_43_13]
MKKIGKGLRKEFLKTMIQLATAGFGLVAALAWNTAIQGIIKRVIPDTDSGLWSQVVYAIIVTSIAVFVTYSLGKMLQLEEEKEAAAEQKKAK